MTKEKSLLPRIRLWNQLYRPSTTTWHWSRRKPNTVLPLTTDCVAALLQPDHWRPMFFDIMSTQVSAMQQRPAINSKKSRIMRDEVQDLPKGQRPWPQWKGKKPPFNYACDILYQTNAKGPDKKSLPNPTRNASLEIALHTTAFPNHYQRYSNNCWRNILYRNAELYQERPDPTPRPHRLEVKQHWLEGTKRPQAVIYVEPTGGKHPGESPTIRQNDRTVHSRMSLTLNPQVPSQRIAFASNHPCYHA